MFNLFKTRTECGCGASIDTRNHDLLMKFYIFHWNPNHQEMVWDEEMGDE